MGGTPNPGTPPDKRLKANKGGRKKAKAKAKPFPGAVPPFKPKGGK